MKNMILLDKPYVSDFLQETLANNEIPVLDSEIAKQLTTNKDLKFISQEDAISKKRENDDFLIFSNSENNISWIEQNLAFSDLPESIRKFKNKIRFREIIRELYPNYFFEGVKFENLKSLDITNLKFPLIIKPAIGFFSMGVHTVECAEEWEDTVNTIHGEIEQNKSIYPIEVINTSEFILEEIIQGEEFAIDCYFNREGNPVITNISKHVFSSGKDVSDRIYFTSKNVIRKHLKPIQDFLDNIAKLVNVKNFPTHVEVRVTETGEIIPIEINPMRFGGWCSSPDLAHHAFGINIYEYFFKRETPNWDEILRNKNDEVTSIVILDNSTGVDENDIKSFDYDNFLEGFTKPLEMRKTNFHEYPVFGMLYCNTEKEDSPELMKILKSNLREFITIAK
jgi:hypothetical protein